MAAAKEFQLKRCQFIEQVWQKDRDLQSWGFYADDDEIESAMQRFRQVIQQAVDIKQLLAGEAVFTKALYKYASEHVNMPDFVRLHDAPAGDKANIFLNHGNYLAYGLAAVTLWVLGIPHGFAVMHGKTRRGALVFDVADLVKMPLFCRAHLSVPKMISGIRSSVRTACRNSRSTRYWTSCLKK